MLSKLFPPSAHRQHNGMPQRHAVMAITDLTMAKILIKPRSIIKFNHQQKRRLFKHARAICKLNGML
jgi:hypothetical protein